MMGFEDIFDTSLVFSVHTKCLIVCLFLQNEVVACFVFLLWSGCGEHFLHDL